MSHFHYVQTALMDKGDELGYQIIPTVDDSSLLERINKTLKKASADNEMNFAVNYFMDEGEYHILFFYEPKQLEIEKRPSYHIDILVLTTSQLHSLNYDIFGIKTYFDEYIETSHKMIMEGNFGVIEWEDLTNFIQKRTNNFIIEFFTNNFSSSLNSKDILTIFSHFLHFLFNNKDSKKIIVLDKKKEIAPLIIRLAFISASVVGFLPSVRYSKWTKIRNDFNNQIVVAINDKKHFKEYQKFNFEKNTLRISEEFDNKNNYFITLLLKRFINSQLKVDEQVKFFFKYFEAYKSLISYVHRKYPKNNDKYIQILSIPAFYELYRKIKGRNEVFIKFLTTTDNEKTIKILSILSSQPFPAEFDDQFTRLIINNQNSVEFICKHKKLIIDIYKFLDKLEINEKVSNTQKILLNSLIFPVEYFENMLNLKKSINSLKINDKEISELLLLLELFVKRDLEEICAYQNLLRKVIPNFSIIEITNALNWSIRISNLNYYLNIFNNKLKELIELIELSGNNKISEIINFLSSFILQEDLN